MVMDSIGLPIDEFRQMLAVIKRVLPRRGAFLPPVAASVHLMRMVEKKKGATYSLIVIPGRIEDANPESIFPGIVR